MTVTELQLNRTAGANGTTPEHILTANRFHGASDRWRPRRAGLFNVWQYADETFDFERGRLVLYGANGSGKTMALELLFPYLLDANGSPWRLSTSGGDERGGLWSRMGDSDGKPSGRVGYLWAEFERRTSSGALEYFTCGTRLEPRSKGGVQSWFTTRLRVGDGLALFGADRVPATVKELRDQLEGHGNVWGDDTGGYRTAVRSTLYPDFSEEQYLSMVDGLLAVRKKSITDKLNADRLHKLLSDGLPALDANELDQVARGFEQLDARRETIADLEASVDAAKALARRVRAHARSVMRLSAARVASANTDFDNVTRNRNQAQETLEAATTTAEIAIAELEQRRKDRDGHDSARLGVLSSSGYASIEELDGHRRRAEDAEATAQRSELVARRRRERAASAAEAEADARSAAERAASGLTEAVSALHAAADAAGVPVEAGGNPERLASMVRGAVVARTLAVDEVRDALQVELRAAEELDRRRGELDDAEVAAAERDLQAAEATTALQEALDVWAEQTAGWASDLVELTVDGAAIADAVADGDLELVAAHAGDALRTAHVALSRADEALERELAALELERGDLNGELGRLEGDGELLSPEPAPWRTASREGREGTALWSLLSPLPGTAASELDALESALWASGLLDAWVHPDGTFELGDVFAVGREQASGTTLAEYLAVDDAAAEAAGVATSKVTAVLAAVAVAGTATGRSGQGLALGLDGSFSYGPVTGRVEVSDARHVGAAARERARRARIAELESAVADLRARAGKLSESRQLLTDRMSAATAEHTRLPATDRVLHGRQASALADDRATAAAGEVSEARERLGAAEGELDGATLEVARVADAYSLPRTIADLDLLQRRLRHVEHLAIALPGAAAAATGARSAADTAEESASEAAGEAADAQETAGTDRRAADAARAEYDSREAAVGEDARATQERLRALEVLISAADRDLERLSAELRVADADRVRAEEQLEALQGQHSAALVRRDVAEAQFVALVAAGLAADAGLAFEHELGSHTAVLGAARQVNRDVTADPDPARAQRELAAIHDERHASSVTLAGRADVSVDVIDLPGDDSSPLPAARATALAAGVAVPVPRLVERLEQDLILAKAELADSETRLFEETLTGSLRAHLASRLRSAQALVDGMNRLLAGIVSSSGGVGVSLRWDVADDVEDRATLNTVKELLLRDHHSTAEREVLFGFLSRRVDLVRHGGGDGTPWREALEALFDYRAWHRFRIMVRHDRYGDKPVAYTARKVSLSTGEQAMVLSLPLFAAVSSHYMPRDEGGAARTCPRLLLLDELFPSNDRDNKRQILGLLAELDLDCVVTSDKDMCDYDTVDGIAIAVLHRDGDGSFATKLTWNGTDLVEDAHGDVQAELW